MSLCYCQNTVYALRFFVPSSSRSFDVFVLVCRFRLSHYLACKVSLPPNTKRFDVRVTEQLYGLDVRKVSDASNTCVAVIGNGRTNISSARDDRHASTD